MEKARVKKTYWGKDLVGKRPRGKGPGLKKPEWKRPSGMSTKDVASLPKMWRVLPKVSAHLTNIIAQIDEYEQIFNGIHAKALQEANCTHPANPIIQTQLAAVDQVEKIFPRVYGTALS